MRSQIIKFKAMKIGDLNSKANLFGQGLVPQQSLPKFWRKKKAGEKDIHIIVIKESGAHPETGD